MTGIRCRLRRFHLFVHTLGAARHRGGCSTINNAVAPQLQVCIFGHARRVKPGGLSHSGLSTTWPPCARSPIRPRRRRDAVEVWPAAARDCRRVDGPVHARPGAARFRRPRRRAPARLDRADAPTPAGGRGRLARQRYDARRRAGRRPGPRGARVTRFTAVNVPKDQAAHAATAARGRPRGPGPGRLLPRQPHGHGAASAPPSPRSSPKAARPPGRRAALACATSSPRGRGSAPYLARLARSFTQAIIDVLSGAHDRAAPAAGRSPPPRTASTRPYELSDRDFPERSRVPPIAPTTHRAPAARPACSGHPRRTPGDSSTPIAASVEQQLQQHAELIKDEVPTAC